MIKLKDLLHEKKDHEGSMAKSQLERSKKYAMMIYKIIQNVDKDGDGEVEFPAWVQSKLTKSMDYLQSVYNYLDGKDGLGDKFQESINEQKTVEIGSAYDNNGEIELVIDKAIRPDSWSTVNFDLTQSFYSGGGSSRETALKRQKKIKLKPSQINKIKKIIKNPEDKNYIKNDNFRVSDILDALKRNK
jgi:hypothetical protein